MRNFEIGDEVEFEVICITGVKWRPRWNYSNDEILAHNKDYGPTRLAIGKVKSVGKKNFVVAPLDSNIHTWGWNQPDQRDTSYGSSGYLRLINSENATSEKPKDNICTCPIQDLWNYGCRCGK